MAFMISATFPLKSFRLSPTKLEMNHIIEYAGDEPDGVKVLGGKGGG